MHPGFRRVLGGLAGLAVALGVIFAVEAVNGTIYPLPQGTIVSSRESMRAALATLPAMALVIVLVGWLIAAVAGAYVATKVAGKVPGPAWVLGGLLLAVTILNLMSVPHPVWFWFPAVLVWPPGIAAGVKLALR